MYIHIYKYIYIHLHIYILFISYTGNAKRRICTPSQHPAPYIFILNIQLYRLDRQYAYVRTRRRAKDCVNTLKIILYIHQRALYIHSGASAIWVLVHLGANPGAVRRPLCVCERRWERERERVCGWVHAKEKERLCEYAQKLGTAYAVWGSFN